MGYEYLWIFGNGYPYLLFSLMDRTSHFFLFGWMDIYRMGWDETGLSHFFLFSWMNDGG